MKIVAAAILFIILLVLGVQVYTFWGRERELSRQFLELKNQLDKATTEKERLQAELDYLSIPANLEKELRSQFNYRATGEKLIILVPPSNESSTNQ